MTQENKNILDLDLNEIDTQFPLLAPGLYELRIADSTVDDSVGGDAKLWKLTFETTQESSSVKGETLAPGLPLYHTITLTPKGKATMELILRNVASVVQACTPPVQGIKGSSIVDGSFANLANVFLGKTLSAKVDIEKERKGNDGRTYPERNVIVKFIKLVG